MAGMIPRRFIDDVLDRVDIVEIVGQRVNLKKTGNSFKACCPFHDEKTPSFNVNADKQFYHCFGCGVGGNAVSFIMDYENVDFPSAIELLAAHLGLDVPREASSNSAVSAAAKKQTESIYDTLQWAARYFQRQLRSHADKQLAVKYLQGRGLSGELARDFGIGYAPAGWSSMIDAALADCSDEADKPERLLRLERAGLIIKKESASGSSQSSNAAKNNEALEQSKSSQTAVQPSAKDYYDRFRERVMFPIRDNRGRVIAFGGRVLGDDKPKYLNSPETQVFHKQRELYGLYESRRSRRELDYLLMVEGYMDVVSLFQFDICCAVATLGTASSTIHLEKVFRYTSKLVVCFDGDEAGEKAARRLMEVALPVLNDGREIRFLFLEAGDDPDTFVRRQGKDAFEYAVDAAQSLEDYMFAAQSAGIDLDSQSGRAKLSTRLLPLIKQIPAGLFQQGLLARLAEQLHLPIEAVKEQFSRTTLPRGVAVSTSEGAKGSSPVRSASVTNASAGQSDFHQADKPRNGNEHHHSIGASSVESEGGGREGSEGSDGELLAGGQERQDLLHLRWAIATLLHYPALALEIALPEALQALDWPEARLLKGIYALVARRVQESGSAPATPAVIGHWHSDQLEPLLLACIGTERPVAETPDIGRTELKETFSAWQRNFEQQKNALKFAALSNQNVRTDQLTPEQITYLRSLGPKTE